MALTDAPSCVTPIETDALIVGAGPVGLFQVFELGLLGIQAHVVDVLPHAGGQCVELYADKPIYDIPAVLACTGRELTERLLLQIKPFAPIFHLGQQIIAVVKQEDGRFLVETNKGTGFISKTLFIAAGVGAFLPRTISIDGIDTFTDTQLFYSAPPPDTLVGKDVLVLGDGDAALDCVINLTKIRSLRPRSVTLMHRRDSFKAEAVSIATMKALCATGDMRFMAGQPTGCIETDGRLTGLEIIDSAALSQIIPLDILLPRLGLSPKLGPVAQWGLAMERKQLQVSTQDFSTSEPGIYAVGDVNTYPGKKKLILCGFHEATLAAFGAKAHIHPNEVSHLEYTTSSPRLHQLLGHIRP